MTSGPMYVLYLDISGPGMAASAAMRREGGRDDWHQVKPVLWVDLPVPKSYASKF